MYAALEKTPAQQTIFQLELADPSALIRMHYPALSNSVTLSKTGYTDGYAASETGPEDFWAAAANEFAHVVWTTSGTTDSWVLYEEGAPKAEWPTHGTSRRLSAAEVAAGAVARRLTTRDIG